MRHGVPEIELEMNDHLNFSAMAGRQQQTNIPANIDYRLFKCLGGNVINKTRRQRSLGVGGGGRGGYFGVN